MSFSGEHLENTCTFPGERRALINTPAVAYFAFISLFCYSAFQLLRFSAFQPFGQRQFPATKIAACSSRHTRQTRDLDSRNSVEACLAAAALLHALWAVPIAFGHDSSSSLAQTTQIWLRLFRAAWVPSSELVPKRSGGRGTIRRDRFGSCPLPHCHMLPGQAAWCAMFVAIYSSMIRINKFPLPFSRERGDCQLPVGLMGSGWDAWTMVLLI